MLKTVVIVGHSDLERDWIGSFLAAAELTVCLGMMVRTWSAPSPCFDPQRAHVVFLVLMNPSPSGWRCVAQWEESQDSFWWWRGPSPSENSQRWRQCPRRTPNQNIAITNESCLSICSYFAAFHSLNDWNTNNLINRIHEKVFLFLFLIVCYALFASLFCGLKILTFLISDQQEFRTKQFYLCMWDWLVQSVNTEMKHCSSLLCGPSWTHNSCWQVLWRLNNIDVLKWSQERIGVHHSSESHNN